MPQFTLHVDSRHMSPYAMSAYVALTEKAVPFTVEHVDLAAGAQREPAYVARSLTGRVPMLQDGAFALSESSAITEYLDELLPPPGYRALYPQPRTVRARARQLQAWLRSDLAALRDARPTTSVFGPPAGTPLPAAAEADAARLVACAETLLPPGAEHLFGAWSIADTDLALMLQRLLRNGDPVPARLAAYAERQWRRPSVARWLALPRPF